MSIQPFLTEPHDYAAAMHVLGVEITVLASRAQTGAYEVTLQEGAEGVGPPPHRHDWDESFFVLDGTVEIVCAQRSVTCGRGAFVHVPRGTSHGYRFGPSGGRMLEMSGPGGFATRMFADVGRRAPEGARDIPKLLDVLAQNGVLVDA